MKLKILTKEGNEKGSQDLPNQFNEPVRVDLIKRAVLSLQSIKRQRYGADPEAGIRASVILSKRRRKYRGMYGHGISRTPRKILSRSGTQFNWQGAFAPNTVGGRRAHPPKAEKEWEKKINKKERRKAIRSALAATINKNLVIERGHLIPDNYPFVLESDIESLDKTKQVLDLLKKFGFEKELERVGEKTIRAGRGKLRGRKYRKKKGLLIVISKECKFGKAVRNIPGVEAINVNAINTELLAPGTIPGRMTLFTQAALERLEKEKLFM
ncbi:50S ribosomal protein L4 [Candidatus Woesearchaeota archaeon]|nr:50S ribosomal protein L4 [Candidatus Woesearchaeota archaeon]